MTSLTKTADIYIRGAFLSYKISNILLIMTLSNSLSSVRLGTVKEASEKHAETFHLFFS